ncbi:hypothetical protein [Pelagicoccus sp. SDUM812003]|uniref:hypothetical protein n=1 Tax=Pelagicoccus sp. SDUM812003 TaxID=3041267 RepID=UPI00280CE24D|nr:hypothetical protein [Pelagicoccus sp. SDUM812003]MDQ8202379.1 hypothetical protein [Pelagicoccus sp. SDUM812003]
MNIGPKARLLMDLAFALGIESADGLLHLPTLYQSRSGHTDSQFQQLLLKLEERDWLDCETNEESTWVRGLSHSGSEKLCDGISPIEMWNARWDGKWRVFSFDIQGRSPATRFALRKWLQRRRFGKVQGSVWIAPRIVAGWDKELAKIDVGPASAIALEGSFLGATKPELLVQRAWKFGEINARYRDYLRFLETQRLEAPEQFSEWYQTESQLWKAAFELDPFLPRDLWPQSDYLGPQALKARGEAYLRAASLTRISSLGAS